MSFQDTTIRCAKANRFFLPAFFLLVLISNSRSQTATPKPNQVPQVLTNPTIIRSVKNDVSPPLRTMVPRQMSPENLVGPPREMREPEENEGKLLREPELRYDPVAQERAGAQFFQAPTVNFEGIANLCNCYPPDPNGDIGPNHYIQTVNTHFAIYSRTGSLLYGPALLHTIWDGFAGPWTGHDDGDPVVLYDHLSDRWIISQFALFGSGSDYELVAVSQTSDPLGAWYRYAFAFSDFPDYPKLSVWPDAYYLTFNRFSSSGSAYLGMAAAALQRDSMLAGHPAQIVLFTNFTDASSGDGLLPSDLDGPPPAVGTPAYFAYVIDGETQGGSDRLGIYSFHVDWPNPPGSTFTGPTLLTPAPFNRMCIGSRSCIPQQGTGQGLDLIGDRLMYRLQYRNFGGYQAMVVNHSVDAGSTRAGVRWYEFRNTGSGWSIFQQSTFAPADGLHRWMGSIAMDKYGNIGLGYAASSSSMYPAIRYTGRRVSDPLGQMTAADTTIMAGTGAQTGSGARWGDYSMLSIDPTDDATFWYTHEYLQTTSPASWQTRIAAFQLPPAVNAFAQGTITDSSTSLPIGSAHVDFVENVTQSTSISQANGSYFAGVKIDSPNTSATYTIRVQKFGYTTHADTVTVFLGDTVTRNIALSTAPGGRLAGRVFRSDSAGVKAAIKIRFNGDVVVDDLQSDSVTGNFNYPLPNGTYDITIDPPSPYANRDFLGIVVNSDTPFVSSMVRYVLEESRVSIPDTLGVGQSNTVGMAITNTTAGPVQFGISISGAAQHALLIPQLSISSMEKLQESTSLQRQPARPTPASNPNAYTSGALSTGSTEKIVRDASVGSVINSWPAPLGITVPWGLAWNKDDGNLLVSDPQGPPIENHYVSDQGVLLQSIPTPWVGNWPGDADYESGQFYQVNVGGNNGIYELNVDGSVVASLTDPDNIWSSVSQRGLAYDAQENVFYIGGWNQNTIYKVKGFGSDNPGKIILSYPFQNVSGLAFHPTSRTLWVAVNASSDMIFEVDPSNGQILQQFPAPGASSYAAAGLAIHGDGNLWCANQTEHKVYLLDSGVPAFSWLMATPTFGQVPAGLSMGIVFTFDATDLVAHTDYNALVHVNINHPDVTGSILIPASLNVTPISGPAIHVRPLVKNFGPVPLTHSKSDTITIRNIGDSTLTVSSISSTNPRFILSLAGGILPGGDSMKSVLTFTPVDSGVTSGSIDIVSNDPTHDTIRVAVSGRGVPVPHFATGIDSLTKTLEGGTQDSIRFFVHNDGTGSGNFSARAIIYPQGAAAVPGAAPVIVPVTLTEVKKEPRRDTQDNPSQESPAPAGSREKKYPPSDIQIKLPDKSLFLGLEQRQRVAKPAAVGDEHLFGAATGMISDINMSTGQVIRSFPTPVPTSDGPTGMAYSGTAIYFTDAFTTSSIYVLDPSNGSVVTSYPAPSLSTDGLAFVDGKLYAMNYSSSQIYELNPDNGQILRTITPPVVIGGGIDGGNGRLFASNFGSHIYELNIATGAVINSFVPVASVYGLGFTGTRLFASVPGGGIAEYEPNTGQFLGMISNFGFAALAGGGGSTWLTILPKSGSIALGDSTQFVATFDASTANIYENPGTYLGRIEISATNSSLAESLHVPARMTVVPPAGARLTVNKPSLRFDTVGIGLSKQLAFRVKNIGAATLSVTNTLVSHTDYSIAPLNFTLASLETVIVTVTFAPAASGPFPDTLRFVSNDSVAQHVVLTGVGVGVPHFIAGVDSINGVLEGGTQDSTQYYVRNQGTGGGDFAARVILYPQTSSPGQTAASPIVIPLKLERQVGRNLPYQSPKEEERAQQVMLPVLSEKELELNGMDAAKYKLLREWNELHRLDGKALPVKAVTSPGQLIEDFERTDWPWAPWVTVAPGGSTVTACAHDGARGIQDPEWNYRTDVSLGSQGDKLSIWVKPGSGRLYLGFGAASGGCWSLVAAANTNQLVLQQNPGYQYTELVTVSQSWTQGVWYRLEVNFEANNLVVGKLYGSDGATLLNSISTTLNGFTAGGVAIRSFTSFCGDNMENLGVGQWLSVRPASGTLGLGDSLAMSAKLDATIQAIYENPGDYNGRVEYAATTSRFADTLKIPAHMKVVPPPGARLTANKSSLNFDTVGIGDSRQRIVRVKNIGASALNVSNTTTVHPEYTVSPAAFSLASLETTLVTITFAPTAGGLLSDTILFVCNDSLAQRIALRGTGLPVPHFISDADSLVKSLEGGALDSLAFRIRNNGTAGGVFTARAIVYPNPGMQPITIPMTIRTVGKASKKVHVRETEPHTATIPAAEGRSTDDVPVKSTPTKISADPGEKVLIIQNNFPWGLNVIEPILDSLGVTVSYSTSTDFFTLDLSQFALIVIPSSQTSGNFYTDIDAHIGVLEGYVSQGGVLEYHATTQGQTAALPGSGTSNFLTDDINTVVLPSHPIVQGVPATVHGTAASHNYFTGLPAGSTVITQNEGNNPTTAEYTLGAGHVIVTGMTWEFSYNYGWDFARMLRNALTYSLSSIHPSWLLVRPAMSTLAVGDSLIMEAVFDATLPEIYENPGDFFGRVEIAASSTSKAETLRVPARMHVVPPAGPRLTVNTLSLNFDTVGVSLTRTLSLRVKNIGAASLTVTNAVTTHPQFHPDSTSFTLASLETLRVNVSFTPTIAGALSDTLRFTSNDPGAQKVVLRGIGGTAVAGTWISQASGTPYQLYCVSTVDENVAWVSGGGGTVRRTTNGGALWVSANLGTDENTGVNALSALRAFVCVNPLSGNLAVLYRTTNGGGTWSSVHSLSQVGAHFNGIQMFDSANGILLGNPVSSQWYIAKTTNGGLNWTQIAGPAQLNGEVGYNNSISWTDKYHGWFGTNKRRVYKTTNGGTSWSSALAPFDDCVGVSFANAQSGIVGGVSGINARSVNGGASWQSSTLCGTDYVYPSGIEDVPLRWWATSGPRIYSTDDQVQWSYDLVAPYYFTHLAMKIVPAANKIVGYAVGYGGQIYKYVETLPVYRPVIQVRPDWNLVSIPVSVADYHKPVLFPMAKSPAFDYEGTYIEKAMLSRRHGYWIKFDSTQTIVLQGFHVSDDSFYVGLGWNILGTLSSPIRSSSIVSVPPGIVNSEFYGFSSGYVPVDSIIPGRGYWVRTTGIGKLVLSSSQAMAKDFPPVQSRLEAFNSLVIEDNDGHRQTLYFGTQPDPRFDVKRFEMPPRPMEGVFDVRFSSGTMLEVSDGVHVKNCPLLISASYPLRISWSVAGASESATLSVGAKRVRMAGEDALTVTKRGDRLALQIGGRVELPKDFALHQNYPNPFNPSTTIKFDLPKQALVTLIIYDVLGKEVRRLYDHELLEGGRYEQVVDATSLATGVYFYRLQAGEYTSVKKMVFLK